MSPSTPSPTPCLGPSPTATSASISPPSDPRWKNADSTVFLRHAGHLVTTAGGRIAHIDLTVIAERLRIGPHRLAMARHIADTLALRPHQVSVKATTTERLGAMGRGEGLAALALCTVEI